VIAVINVMGIIAQHASQVDNISGPGGTSTERVTNSLRSAVADPNVTSIVLNVDSPGGSVSGVQALADEIYNSRGKKPIIAQVNSMMASAAYWIGAAADEIVMTPGSQAGSIGVYLMHKDVSAAAEKEGVKITFVKAGKYKTEANPFEILGKDAATSLQATVDSYYADFINGVAKFRGVSSEDVRNGFGEGRVVKDKMAVKAGMADSIATLDETLRRLTSKMLPFWSSRLCPNLLPKIKSLRSPLSAQMNQMLGVVAGISIACARN
jgi:signal peptide peptidase SppA